MHDNPRSSNAQKVRLLLRELDEPFTAREVPFAGRPQWHLDVNPTGGIPALVDGDVALAESNAILRYLATRAGRDDLYPAAPAERAHVEWLLDHIATWFRPTSREIEEVAFGLRPGSGLFAAPPEPERLPAVMAEVAARLAATEALLGPEPFAAAGRFTIADVAAAPFLHRIARSGADLAPHPRLAAWAAAVLARPTWQAMVAEVGV